MADQQGQTENLSIKLEPSQQQATGNRDQRQNQIEEIKDRIVILPSLGEIRNIVTACLKIWSDGELGPDEELTKLFMKLIRPTGDSSIPPDGNPRNYEEIEQSLSELKNDPGNFYKHLEFLRRLKKNGATFGIDRYFEILESGSLKKALPSEIGTIYQELSYVFMNAAEALKIRSRKDEPPFTTAPDMLVSYVLTSFVLNNIADRYLQLDRNYIPGFI